jgi:hypothetical protein
VDPSAAAVARRSGSGLNVEKDAEADEDGDRGLGNEWSWVAGDEEDGAINGDEDGTGSGRRSTEDVHARRRRDDLRPPGRVWVGEAGGEQGPSGGEVGRGADGVDQPAAAPCSDWNLGSWWWRLGFQGGWEGEKIRL